MFSRSSHGPHHEPAFENIDLCRRREALKDHAAYKHIPTTHDLQLEELMYWKRNAEEHKEELQKLHAQFLDISSENKDQLVRYEHLFLKLRCVW